MVFSRHGRSSLGDCQIARRAWCGHRRPSSPRRRRWLSASEAMIRHLKLEIAKLRRAQYGQSSERRARLIEQMELELEELEADATEDEIAAERAARRSRMCLPFERRRPARKPFPEHFPCERVVIEAPSRLHLLRFGADREDGRRHHRDAGGDPSPVESDPDGAREVHLPGLREDLAATSFFPRHTARMGRTEPARHNSLREVRPASAVEPPGRALHQGRRRSQPLHAGRSGRGLRDSPAADP